MKEKENRLLFFLLYYADINKKNNILNIPKWMYTVCTVLYYFD